MFWMQRGLEQTGQVVYHGFPNLGTEVLDNIEYRHADGSSHIVPSFLVPGSFLTGLLHELLNLFVHMLRNLCFDCFFGSHIFL